MPAAVAEYFIAECRSLFLISQPKKQFGSHLTSFSFPLLIMFELVNNKINITLTISNKNIYNSLLRCKVILISSKHRRTHTFKIRVRIQYAYNHTNHRNHASHTHTHTLTNSHYKLCSRTK